MSWGTLFFSIRFIAHEETVHGGELPPEAVLEFSQFAVKGEVVGLYRDFGHTVACDALDVMGGQGVVAGDVVIIVGAEVALEDVSAREVAVGGEDDAVTAAQHQRQAVALGHAQHALVKCDLERECHQSPGIGVGRDGKGGRVEVVVIHHFLA